jgi:hypothetical protein
MNSTKNTCNLYLNSKQAIRKVNGSTSDCIFDFNNLPIDDGDIFVSVQTAQIPCTFYNVDTINNLLVYSVNGGANINLVIPPSNYNVNTLMAYLMTVMTGFTITYNTASNKYTFTHATSTFSFKSTSTCFELIGFLDDAQYNSSGLVLVSTISINFFTIRNILIECSNLITVNKTSNILDTNCSILTSIPITVSQGSILSYSNVFGLSDRVASVKNFASLQIRLLDQDLDLLNLNGCEWNITLQLNY